MGFASKTLELVSSCWRSVVCSPLQRSIDLLHLDCLCPLEALGGWEPTLQWNCVKLNCTGISERYIIQKRDWTLLEQLNVGWCRGGQLWAAQLRTEQIPGQDERIYTCPPTPTPCSLCLVGRGSYSVPLSCSNPWSLVPSEYCSESLKLTGECVSVLWDGKCPLSPTLVGGK